MSTSRKSRSVDRLPRPGKDRTKGTGLEGLRPTVKKLEAEQPASQQDQVELAGEEEREERVFNPAGYEAHLVETIEKDILQRNPDVAWNKVAGLHEAKAILQEAMVLPILMPDFFKVAFRCPVSLGVAILPFSVAILSFLFGFVYGRVAIASSSPALCSFGLAIYPLLDLSPSGSALCHLGWALCPSLSILCPSRSALCSPGSVFFRSPSAPCPSLSTLCPSGSALCPFFPVSIISF